MKNMSIGIKMTLLVAVMLATAVTIAFVGITELVRLNANFARIVQVESRANTLAHDLRIELLLAIRAEKNAILVETPADAVTHATIARSASQRIGELRDELSEMLARAESQSQTDSMAAGGRSGGLAEFDRDLAEFIRNQEEILKLAVVKSEAQAEDIVFIELQQRGQDFVEFVQTLPSTGDGAAVMGPAREALRHMHRLMFALAAHLRSLDEKSMSLLALEIRQDYAQLLESLRRLTSVLSESDRARGLAVISGLDGAKAIVSKAMELSEENSNKRAQILSASKAVELGNRCDAALKSLVSRLASSLDAAATAAEQSVDGGRTTIIVTAIIGGVISLLMAFVVIRSITGPVAHGVAVIQSIAEGDLTRRMGLNQTDEIGRLAAATDEMSSRLQKGVARTRTLANTLDTSAIALSAVSHDLLAQNQEMATQAESVASATEQMSTNVSGMAAAAEQMSVNISSISSASEELSVNVGTISSSAARTSRNVGAVAEAIERITTALSTVADDARTGSKMGQDARDLATAATSAMRQLDAAADDINKVTDVIKAIALQTNLLAINATIEATSAGEAGRGFAVVASEIKELASQSGQSAGDIANKIESVQASTAEAVRVIDNVAEFISKLSVAVARISDSVQAQTQTANRVSSDVAGARDGVDDIARAIAEVAKGATDVSANTAQLSRAAIDVSRNATEAASAARSIAPNIYGVSEATRTSSQSVASVNESAKRLREISGELLRNVSHFRTGTDESQAPSHG